ncbi:MAG: hypothetical protein K9L62_10910 [Vallitaleaceae bacterium]|nr:hypothetical protein [Vallitaleaceae bacterium]
MICGYGCNQKAKFPPKKGMNRWCCEKHFNKCPAQIKIKTDLALKSGKLHGRVPWNKNKKGFQKAWNKGRKWSLESRKKMSISSRLTILQIKERYPFFSKIEEMRYNPDNLNEKEIQVHCKNHNCPNSKEQGGWFTPTYIQLFERIRQLEKTGHDICYFYCSKRCKIECPLYQSKGNDPFKIINHYYTHKEYQQFRLHVFKRDNYKCQYCGEKAEHVHHERPQKLEPFYSLDPDFAWSCCEKCHYEKGHKDECSTGNLASKICKGE